MIGSEYNNFEYTPEFSTDVNHTLPLQDSIYGYSIDGKDMSLYEVLSFFKTFTPKIITRFKGLGQQDSKDLERTVMNKKARHSIRLTMSNIKETYERLAVMHSKKPQRALARKRHIAQYEFDPMVIDT